MLAKVDILGLLWTGHSLAIFPPFCDTQPNHGVGNRGLVLWTKKRNDFQKGSRPNSGPNCIFLGNEVGLSQSRDLEKDRQHLLLASLDSNAEFEPSTLRDPKDTWQLSPGRGNVTEMNVKEI